MSSKKYFDFHPPVFIPSALIIILFVGVVLAIGEPAEELFGILQSGLYNNVGWFFIFIMNVLLVTAAILAFGPLGKIRIGGAKAKPEFSNLAWYSMLFSAGMGIGLIYFGVAEPIKHFNIPPTEVDTEMEAVQQAFNFTFLHYGLHPWGAYGMVALALAFFTYNMKLPLAMRSLFYPIIKRKIHGPFGNTVDVLAVIACLFGLATTLGLGAQQLTSGLAHLFGIPNTTTSQVVIITLVTFAATISVVLGIDKGVKNLSVFNIYTAVALLLAMLIIGPTVYILDGYIENVGSYFGNLVSLSTYTEAFSEKTWQNGWTLFYYAWWIAWSPFVGIFIARVSKGRTVKEFLVSVVLLPSFVSFFWFSVFGGAAMYLQLNGIGDIGAAVNADRSTALFYMFDMYPISEIMSFVGVILIITFFVTSSDSGSLVVDSLTAGGKLDAPVAQRVFWALTEGALAATLLIGGGLTTLQTAVMLAALPFGITLLLMVYSLILGLKHERHKELRNKVARRRSKNINKWEYHYREVLDTDPEEVRENS